MKIGEVSERFGIPASTIRYYEKVGLIEYQRRVSGRRVFDKQALLVLQLVQLSQAAGFSIAETKALIDSYSASPNDAGAWKDHAKRKQSSVRSQIEKLKQMDKILSAMLSCNCHSLTECVEKGLPRHAKY